MKIFVKNLYYSKKSELILFKFIFNYFDINFRTSLSNHELAVIGIFLCNLFLFFVFSQIWI